MTRGPENLGHRERVGKQWVVVSEQEMRTRGGGQRGGAPWVRTLDICHPGTKAGWEQEVKQQRSLTPELVIRPWHVPSHSSLTTIFPAPVMYQVPPCPKVFLLSPWLLAHLHTPGDTCGDQGTEIAHDLARDPQPAGS